MRCLSLLFHRGTFVCLSFILATIRIPLPSASTRVRKLFFKVGLISASTGPRYTRKCSHFSDSDLCSLVKQCVIPHPEERVTPYWSQTVSSHSPIEVGLLQGRRDQIAPFLRLLSHSRVSKLVRGRVLSFGAWVGEVQ